MVAGYPSSGQTFSRTRAKSSPRQPKRGSIAGEKCQMSSPQWRADPRFAYKPDRVRNWDALHALMAQWSRRRMSKAARARLSLRTASLFDPARRVPYKA